MGTDSMTCAEAEPLLPLVADGAVDPDSDPALFSHLAACPACQRVVASHDLIALAIARAPAPRRRAPIVRLLPWTAAAAAGLLLALGLAATSASSSSAPPPVAFAPPAPAATITPSPAIAPAPALPEVIAVPRSDGTTIYLVRRGEAWVRLDTQELDGPTQPGPGGSGSGVQVRY
jgi:hypothetical protein